MAAADFHSGALPYLLDAADLRGQQQTKVVKWHAGEDSVTPLLIKQVEKITKAKAWPKICINLRSTRRTELDDHFPGHVVSTWLGHSEKVAREHYQQVTVDHWDRASKLVSTQVSISGGQEGIRGVQSDATESENSEKPEEKQHSIAVADSAECPRKDSNEIALDQAKHGTIEHSDAAGTASCTAEMRLSDSELLSLWHKSTSQTKANIIALLLHPQS